VENIADVCRFLRTDLFIFFKRVKKFDLGNIDVEEFKISLIYSLSNFKFFIPYITITCFLFLLEKTKTWFLFFLAWPVFTFFLPTVLLITEGHFPGIKDINTMFVFGVWAIAIGFPIAIPTAITIYFLIYKPMRKHYNQLEENNHA
jgi:hypothetical protein